MHKDVEVALLLLDDINGSIKKCLSVFAAEHLPYGIIYKKNLVDRTSLNDWWEDRCIPEYRSGVEEALRHLGSSDTRKLVPLSLGVSLTDHYWLRPEASTLCWEDVNYYRHDFSNDVGDILFGLEPEGPIDFHSPDITCDGYLKKRWRRNNGVDYLYKGGSAPYQQQPFCEEAACVVMEALKIKHVKYHTVVEQNVPYSVCNSFIHENTEFVSAWRIISSVKKPNNRSLYQHYITLCQSMGVNDIVKSVDQMILTDFLIANEDRHLNNFGLLRNPDTLSFIGSAPVFDSGSSFGYEKSVHQIRTRFGTTCKPFKKTHEEQLRLVTSFDGIDFDHLTTAAEKLKTIFLVGEGLLGRERIQAIIDAYLSRVRYLKQYSETSHVRQDDVKADVKKNIAADYR